MQSLMCSWSSTTQRYCSWVHLHQAHRQVRRESRQWSKRAQRPWKASCLLKWKRTKAKITEQRYTVDDCRALMPLTRWTCQALVPRPLSF
ncbi:hypothetical protein FGO68_gene15226 [Halteria grandinella]|uniref:Uncharacterized protein n=1 Tax=Halteria grandinella TaxID=5974 RepID=A0A8J8NNV5_HALGN|nr:hypothetical protein FGO68_gene15226 [Halteria grandinella]